MCNVCGCSEGESRIEGQPVLAHDHAHAHHHDHHHPEHHHHDHAHYHDNAHAHEHSHSHDHVHADNGDLHYGQGPAGAHAPGMSQSRMVQIEQDILGKNNEYARANRVWLQARAVLALNLVSSPGSGKTSLLTHTLCDLQGEFSLQVIEGDQQTSNDAERIRATGADAIQINTGKGCHLDAHQVGHALESLNPPAGSMLFIENVGNLVCPASFDLGEAHKVAILSVTEGEDKPIKYPDMFHAADLLLLNKVDLLPHLQFNVELCMQYARRVNPGIQILQVSAITGEGMQTWYEWLRLSRTTRMLGHPLAGDTGVGDQARAEAVL